MTLQIDRIYPQHFRTYYFRAQNVIGSAEHRLVLGHSGLHTSCDIVASLIFHFVLCPLKFYLPICDYNSAQPAITPGKIMYRPMTHMQHQLVNFKFKYQNIN